MKVKRICQNCGTSWYVKEGFGTTFLEASFSALATTLTKGSIMDTTYNMNQRQQKKGTCPNCNSTVFRQETENKKKTTETSTSIASGEKEDKSFTPREKKGCIIGCLSVIVAIIILIAGLMIHELINEKKNKEMSGNASFEKASSLLQSSDDYERVLKELNSISSDHEKYGEAQKLKQKADSLLSEKNYKLGKIFFDDKQYAVAVTHLKKISSKHRNYNEAMAMIIDAEKTLNEQNYKSGEKLFDAGKYDEALSVLKNISSKYKDYNKVKDMIKVAEFSHAVIKLTTYMNDKIIVNSILNRNANYSKLDEAGKLTNLKYILAWFGATAMNIKQCEDFQNIELAYLEPNKRNKLKNEFKKLASQAKNKLKSDQRREFPILRKEFAKIMDAMAKKSAGNKVQVQARGSGNSRLEHIGATFANEADVEEFQKILVETGMTKSIKLFRFKRVSYRWSEYDENYTYFSYDTPEDDVEVSENEGK